MQPYYWYPKYIIPGITTHICYTLFRNITNISDCILINMTNKKQTTSDPDNGQPLESSPTSEPTGDNSSFNPVAYALDSEYHDQIRKHIDPDYKQSLDSSPPGVAQHQTILGLKRLRRSISINKCAEKLLEIWLMIVAVLPQGIPCDLQDIYAAMLRCFKTIPFENWEKSVREILVSESRRSDSPINQYNEDSFFVNVDIESWLSTREDYSPDLVSIAQQEVEEKSRKVPVVRSSGESFSTEDAHSLENRGVISDGPLAGFDHMNPAAPPGMSPERVIELTIGILNMNDPEIRSTLIEIFLQLPKLDALRHSRGLWRMALYNGVLLKTVFGTFCELANESSTYAEIILDTIFCIELQPQDEEAPFNRIVKAGIKLPPNVSVVRVAGFLYLLKYMNQSPDNWNIVISWLLEKHTNRFKSLFLYTLGNVGRYNGHLQGAVQSIIKELLHCKSWGSILLTGSAYND